MAAVDGVPSRRRFGLRPSIDVNSFFRKGILLATNNRFVTEFVQRYGMRLGAARFVAGESFEACVPILRDLNAQGFRTNTTLLGEAVADQAKAAWVVDEYIAVLDRIRAENLVCNVALKLTHLGLDLGEDVAYQNVERLVIHAKERGNFIRIDMEESARVDATLRIYRRLREAGHDNVGTVLQSYLYRTEEDLQSLLPLKPNLRLVKGAYLEPPSVAFPQKAEVDRQFMNLAKTMLRENAYTAVATHDDRLIEQVIAFARANDIPRDRFEFQMLYGIRPQLQRILLARGYTVLIATPHGPEWYYYFMRRLAERPANLLFFAKSLIQR